MTTIATDAVYYDDAEMIRARANFFPALQIEPDQIGPILGKYRLATDDRGAWVTCGLNGCNQLHKVGFLISNKAGQETICGSTCGQNKLGTAWDEVEAEFELKEDAAARKRLADDLLMRRDSLLKQCAEVLPRAGRAAAHMQQFQRDFQRRVSVWGALVRCSKQGGVVRDSVKTSGKFQERSQRETLMTIGTIKGAEVILNDRAGLVGLIRTEIEPWIQLNLIPDVVGSMDTKALEEFTRKAAVHASKIVEAEKYADSVGAFISPQTFVLIEEMRVRKIFSDPGYGWDKLMSEWAQRLSAPQ